ncbi:MAG TPA: helix-turn-helix domain-containing protein [Acidimicrobiales bacterium]|nr:helix-turn-helix domain-containing protein [Acidimicrobiales bacterium]
MSIAALVAALASSDEKGARSLLEGDGSGPDDIARLLVSAGHELARQQLGGVLDGAVVAAATALGRRLLATSVIPSQPLRSTPVVVISPPAEAHRIDADGVGAALRGSGWSVDQLSGPDAAEDLYAFLSARSAHALAVTCSGSGELPAAAAALGAAQRAGVPAVVTGPAFGGDDLRALRLGADAWAPDLRSVLAVVARWADHRPERGQVTATPPEYTALQGERLALMAAADATMSCGPGYDEPRRQDLVAVVAHLGAAVLVDDSRVLLDFLSTGLAVPEREDAAARLLDALAVALPVGLRRSRDFVEDARRHTRHALGRSARLPAPSTSPAPGTWNRPGHQAEAGDGQVFADLLLLGATACQVPMALLSVPRPGGGWSTLSFGVERRHLAGAESLLEYVARRHEGVEVSDLLVHPELSKSPFAVPPLGARWLYGIPARSSDGSVIGVFCVLERMNKQMTAREQRAVRAVARQMGGHLEQWRRASTAGQPPGEVGPVSRRSGGLAGVEIRPEGPQLLRSHEVAALFDVTERTVINWAASGKLASLRTMGGHLRFRRDDVVALLAGRNPEALRSG